SSERSRSVSGSGRAPERSRVPTRAAEVTSRKVSRNYRRGGGPRWGRFRDPSSESVAKPTVLGAPPRDHAQIRSDVVLRVPQGPMEVARRVGGGSLGLLQTVASAGRTDRDHPASLVDGFAEVQRGVIELVRDHGSLPKSRGERLNEADCTTGRHR